jgi:hypothetical protein
MVEASLEAKPMPLNRKWAGRPQGRWSAAPLFECGGRGRARVSSGIDLRCAGAGFHTGYSRVLTRITGKCRNQGTQAGLRGQSYAVAKTIGDRLVWGRSLRSSRRAGKPSTWRRETVGAACRQEAR